MMKPGRYQLGIEIMIARSLPAVNVIPVLELHKLSLAKDKLSYQYDILSATFQHFLLTC